MSSVEELTEKMAMYREQLAQVAGSQPETDCCGCASRLAPRYE